MSYVVFTQVNQVELVMANVIFILFDIFYLTESNLLILNNIIKLNLLITNSF